MQMIVIPIFSLQNMDAVGMFDSKRPAVFVRFGIWNKQALVRCPYLIVLASINLFFNFFIRRERF